jgi:hypothetical protein
MSIQFQIFKVQWSIGSTTQPFHILQHLGKPPWIELHHKLENLVPASMLCKDVATEFLERR